MSLNPFNYREMNGCKTNECHQVEVMKLPNQPKIKEDRKFIMCRHHFFYHFLPVTCWWYRQCYWWAETTLKHPGELLLTWGLYSSNHCLHWVGNRKTSAASLNSHFIIIRWCMELQRWFFSGCSCLGCFPFSWSKVALNMDHTIIWA